MNNVEIFPVLQKGLVLLNSMVTAEHSMQLTLGLISNCWLYVSQLSKA